MGFEVEELDAHRAAACGADALGVDTDDLAELADHHQLAGLVDEIDLRHLAVLRRGLDVDDALAATGLEAVLVDVGALAVAVLRDRQDEAGSEAELLVELVEFGLCRRVDGFIAAEELLTVGRGGSRSSRFAEG